MEDRKFVFIMLGLLCFLGLLLMTVSPPSEKTQKKQAQAGNLKLEPKFNHANAEKKLEAADIKINPVVEKNQKSTDTPVAVTRENDSKVKEPKDAVPVTPDPGTAAAEKLAAQQNEVKPNETDPDAAISSEILATHKWGKVLVGEFLNYYNRLDPMRKVALAKKSLFNDFTRFFVQGQVAYNLGLDEGYLKFTEMIITLRQQKQWFVVEKTVHENVYQKTVVTDKEIAEYYENNKEKEYAIKPSVDGILFSSSDMTALQKLKTEAQGEKSIEEIRKRNVEEYKADIKELKNVSQGSRGDVFDRNVILKDFTGCSEIFQENGKNSFFKVLERRKHDFRPFETVKPHITSTIKSRRSKEIFDSFMESLRSKYHAEIHPDIQAAAFAFCKSRLESFAGKSLKEIMDDDFQSFYESLQKAIPEELKNSVMISIKGNDLKATDFIEMCFVIPAFYTQKKETVDAYLADLSGKMRDQEVIYIEGLNSGYDKDKLILQQLEEFQRNMISNEYTRRLINTHIDFSEPRLRKYYEDHPGEFVEKEQRMASHVLVSTMEEAEKIRQDIEQNRISFEEAAKKFSMCPSSKAGGDLGWFGQGRMTPAFEKSAFNLKNVGDLSGIVSTEFGFHIIKLTGKKEAGTKKFEDSIDAIKNKIHRAGLKEIEEKVRTAILDKGMASFPNDIIDRLFYHLFPSERPKGYSDVPPEQEAAPRQEEKKEAKPVEPVTPDTGKVEKQPADQVEKVIGKAEVNPGVFVVARLGKKEFTFQQFMEHYNELPFQQKNRYKDDKGIVRCMQDMLMDWSVYNEGVDSGFLSNETVQMMIGNIEKVITVQAIVGEYLEPMIPLEESEIEKYYNSNKIRFTVPEMIRIREIVTGDQAVAGVVLEKLKQGTAFEELVRNYSVGQSKSNDGIVEYFPRKSQTEEFDIVAFSLKKEEVSGVIKHQNMYKIIKLLDKQEPRVRTLDEVRPFISSQLKQSLKMKFVEGQVEEMKKKLHFNANYEYLKIITPDELARVKDEKLFIFDQGSVTVGEFFKQLDFLPAQMKNDVNPERRKAILKNMENVYILYSLKDKLSAAMKKKVQLIKERETVQAVAGQVRNAKVSEINEKIKISDEEILKFYEKNKELYSVPPKRRLKQIAVKTREEAKEIIAELLEGESFGYLAKSRSTDRGTASKGGELGLVAENQVLKPIGKAMMELDIGQITDEPVETAFGFYILKVEESVPGKITELSEIRAKLLEKLKRDAQLAEIDKWHKALSDKYQGVVYEKELLRAWENK